MEKKFSSSIYRRSRSILVEKIHLTRIFQNQCLFTDSAMYIAFSSLVSFYIPLILILFAYGKVFIIATRHSQGLRKGVKKVSLQLDEMRDKSLNLDETKRQEEEGRRI